MDFASVAMNASPGKPATAIIKCAQAGACGMASRTCVKSLKQVNAKAIAATSANSSRRLNRRRRTARNTNHPGSTTTVSV